MVYVIDIHGNPLMPTHRLGKVRRWEERSYCRDLVQQRILKHLSFAGIRPAWQETPEVNYLASLITITPIFHGITQAESRLIAENAALKRIEPNIIIAQSGEIVETMFMVIEGLLVAETRRGIGTKPLPPEILSPGNLVGGVAMLMNDVHESTVLSKTACLLFEIDYKLLEKLLTQYPKIVNIITQNIAQITLKNSVADSQWQMGEADIAAEVLRNLKRQFIHLKLD